MTRIGARSRIFMMCPRVWKIVDASNRNNSRCPLHSPFIQARAVHMRIMDECESTMHTCKKASALCIHGMVHSTALIHVIFKKHFTSITCTYSRVRLTSTTRPTPYGHARSHTYSIRNALSIPTAVYGRPCPPILFFCLSLNFLALILAHCPQPFSANRK